MEFAEDAGSSGWKMKYYNCFEYEFRARGPKKIVHFNYLFFCVDLL